MKKNRFLILFLIALVVVSAGVAIWHNTTRVTAPEGTLRIEYGETVTQLPLDQLTLTSVQGTLVNGTVLQNTFI